MAKEAKKEIGERLSYKYRLYPTKKQEAIFNQNIGCCRFVFNHYLNARKVAYENTCKTLSRPKLAPGADPNEEHPLYERDEKGKIVYEDYLNDNYDPCAKSMSLFDTTHDLTELKKEIVDEEGHAWLTDADATALIYALRHLDAAFQNFFRGIKKGQKVGYPRFKSKKNAVKAYTTGGAVLVGVKNTGELIKKKDFTTNTSNAGIAWKYLYLPKVGNVKIKVHDNIPQGKFISATISQNAAGHWFASINVKEVIIPKLKDNDEQIGLTFGISSWVTTSQGEIIQLPEKLDLLEKRLIREQKNLSRKQEGSTSWQKQKLKVARINEKIANLRRDITHKTTREIVNEYGVIATREMNSKKMAEHKGEATKNLPKKVQRHLNKGINNGNFFEFNRQLAYKAEWAGRAFTIIPADTPTAQVCSNCGHKQTTLASNLKPEWTCDECQTTHSRKYNGAVNVLAAGLEILQDQEKVR